ncbi:hypothetical protein JOC76_001851 [Neobacillus cucumis]|nr:hypothetical protein [Neobacillus cucumis]
MIIVDFGTMLIGAEGARLLENAIAFSSCVGGPEEEYQSPAGVRGRGDPADASASRRLPGTPAESERLERKSTSTQPISKNKRF